MPWLTLRLQVTTPLFNGGADVGDTDGTGVRVPSVRGAMRWWFRALAGGLVGPDLELLWRLERKVFGGATTGDKGVPSPIRLRIPEQPSLTLANARHDFLPGPQATSRERAEHNGYWIVYLLGQGLGNLRECSLRRPYVAPGEEFDLKIDVGGGPHAALALASLWLTCAYGGVGSRIRRGFGGLRIIGSSGALPEPWTPQSILTPGLEHYTDLRHLWPKDPIVACMKPLVSLIESERGRADPDAWRRPPPFPVLSRKYTTAGLSGDAPFTTWDSLLSHAGEQLRLFRGSEEHPDVRYTPRVKTPEWEGTVHGDSNRFPVGALGLPVVYKDGYVVNAWGDKEHRRASPVWLRPVGSPGDLRLFSFAFLGDFLPGPNAPEVRLRRRGGPARPLHINTEDVRTLAQIWIDQLAKPEWEWFPPDSRPAP